MKLSLATGVALVIASTTVLPGMAGAQDAPPPPATVTTQETTSQATGPSMAMVGSGLVIFGLSYIPAVVVGSTSGLNADRTMLVPIAGPWIDLTQRPGCSPGTSCNAENTDKVLIVVDGVFQAIGALTVLTGFLTTAHETKTTVQSAALTQPKKPTVRISPAQIGTTGGYGMVALGTF